MLRFANGQWPRALQAKDRHSRQTERQLSTGRNVADGSPVAGGMVEELPLGLVGTPASRNRRSPVTGSLRRKRRLRPTTSPPDRSAAKGDYVRLTWPSPAARGKTVCRWVAMRKAFDTRRRAGSGWPQATSKRSPGVRGLQDSNFCHVTPAATDRAHRGNITYRRAHSVQRPPPGVLFDQYRQSGGAGASVGIHSSQAPVLMRRRSVPAPLAEAAESLSALLPR